MAGKSVGKCIAKTVQYGTLQPVYCLTQDEAVSRPSFPPAKREKVDLTEMRKIPVPNNRYVENFFLFFF